MRCSFPRSILTRVSPPRQIDAAISPRHYYYARATCHGRAAGAVGSATAFLAMRLAREPLLAKA